MALKAKHNAVARQKLRRFLLVKEIVMISLVVGSFCLLALEHFEKLPHDAIIFIDAYEIVISLLFLAEFAFEWHYALDRAKYFRHHWFYLFAAIPLLNGFAEYLHGIRLLRLLKLLRVFAHTRYEYNTHLFEEHR